MIFWSLFEGMACKASCLELSLNLCFDVFIYYLKLSIKSKQKAASILKTISFIKEVQADRGIPIELSKKNKLKVTLNSNFIASLPWVAMFICLQLFTQNPNSTYQSNNNIWIDFLVWMKDISHSKLCYIVNVNTFIDNILFTYVSWYRINFSWQIHRNFCELCIYWFAMYIEGIAADLFPYEFSVTYVL